MNSTKWRPKWGVAALAGLLLCLPAADSRAQQGIETLQDAAANAVRSELRAEELRADILMARKMYAEAADVLKKMVDRQPSNAHLLNKLGIAYYQQEKLSAAKKYYERAARADAYFASAVNNIGTVQYHRKKYASAAKYYRQAIGIEPETPAFHTNLGHAYFHMKKYEEAVVAFHEALRLDPLIFDRRGGVGSILQHRGTTNRPLFFYYLAKSFARMGNAEKCAQYLRKAREEGYKGMSAAPSDPAFSHLLNDPLVREALQLPPLPPQVQN